jgi:hypothetical protein
MSRFVTLHRCGLKGKAGTITSYHISCECCLNPENINSVANVLPRTAARSPLFDRRIRAKPAGAWRIWINLHFLPLFMS